MATPVPNSVALPAGSYFSTGTLLEAIASELEVPAEFVTRHLLQRLRSIDPTLPAPTRIGHATLWPVAVVEAYAAGVRALPRGLQWGRLRQAAQLEGAA